MNIDFIKRNNITYENDLIDEISKSVGVEKNIAELLIMRGVKSVAEAKSFLNSDINNMHDPFLFKGMKEAVEKITFAIENNQKVVVYGDYDADGVCAASILSLFLSSKGLDIVTYIPNRVTDGYGLSVDSVEKIIDNIQPDLILTCDCGISAAVEVEHAMDLGVDVIVTDHHEVSGEIPNCIIINPKQEDCNYPINYLCGAGVALKLVQAIGGIDEAEKYFELAAVATIADLVPLIDENRLIVQLGLKKIKNGNLGLKTLLEDQGLTGNVTSLDIAFKVVPRINAAGRMGDAFRAFEMLTTTSIGRVKEILKEINSDNDDRKALCDEQYEDALNIIKTENITNSRAIIISHPTWEKGITGILAAKIASDYKRPAFILVKADENGEIYKGTARSINNINVYELLTSVSDLLEEFGGHNQAAGYSIKYINIPEFKVRVNEYLSQFDNSLFLPNVEYDIEIELDKITFDFAKSLDVLEPFGNSNPRPIFKTFANSLQVSSCKSNTKHTSITTPNGLQILAFNFYNENQYLLGDFKKELALEVATNYFANKENLKVILKGISPSKLYIDNNVSKANYIKSLAYKDCNDAQKQTYEKSDLNNLLDDNIYGTLIISSNSDSYDTFNEKYGNKLVLHEFLYSTSFNNYTKIIVSPLLTNDLALSNYSKIIFLDSNLGDGIIKYINTKTSALVYVPKNNNEKELLKELTTDRETFGKYYEAVRKNNSISTTNIFCYYDNLSQKVSGINLQQFVFCTIVFHELGLYKIPKDKFEITIDTSKKFNLCDSSIYSYVKEKS